MPTEHFCVRQDSAENILQVQINPFECSCNTGIQNQKKTIRYGNSAKPKRHITSISGLEEVK